MPTYEFKCKVEECGHEWEDFLSIKAPDPDECPKCHAKDQVLRLISGGSGRGKVELTGQELVDSIKADAQKIKAEASKNEKVYANLLGEEKYHQMQTQMDRRKRH